ncbi:hypothetical protein [Hoeflea sp.]
MKREYETPAVEKKGRLEQLTAGGKPTDPVFSGFKIPTGIFDDVSGR